MANWQSANDSLLMEVVNNHRIKPKSLSGEVMKDGLGRNWFAQFLLNKSSALSSLDLSYYSDYPWSHYRNRHYLLCKNCTKRQKDMKKRPGKGPYLKTNYKWLYRTLWRWPPGTRSRPLARWQSLSRVLSWFLQRLDRSPSTSCWCRTAEVEIPASHPRCCRSR